MSVSAFEEKEKEKEQEKEKEIQEKDLVGRGMRFCRSGNSGRDIVHEAVVQEVDEEEFSVKLKFISALPPLHMGDLLVLESMDGKCQWQSDVKHCGDRLFFEGGNDQRYLKSVVVYVYRGKGTKLLRTPKQIFVMPTPSSTSFPTCNLLGAASQRRHKGRPNEAQNRAKAKIKIGINGYGIIARTMVMIALSSQDVELVAINDPLTYMAQSTCMFRYPNLHQGWRSDFKMKDPNTLLFGEKEVTLFRIKERRDIPWNCTGAEYIVEASDYDSAIDAQEVCTKISKYNHYSPNANPIGDRLSPLAEVLQGLFGAVEDVSTAERLFPVLLQIKSGSPHAAAAMAKVLPHWKGRLKGLIFKVPIVDASPINIGIELAWYKDYRVMSSTTRPSDGFDMLLGWCVEMIRQIPEVVFCGLLFK